MGTAACQTPVDLSRAPGRWALGQQATLPGSLTGVMPGSSVRLLIPGVAWDGDLIECLRPPLQEP